MVFPYFAPPPLGRRGDAEFINQPQHRMRRTRRCSRGAILFPVIFSCHFRVSFVFLSWPTAVFRLNRRFVFNQAAFFAATRIAILAQLADQDGNLLEL
jgi:hypothetical protein